MFLIWERGEESMKLFFDKINSIHLTIKFTADWSYSSVNFLDVKVILKDGKIITYLYVKPTDTHQCSDSSSCHPHRYRKNIPYSQALRLNRMPSLIRDVTNYSIGYMDVNIVKELLGKNY